MDLLTLCPFGGGYETGLVWEWLAIPPPISGLNHPCFSISIFLFSCGVFIVGVGVGHKMNVDAFTIHMGGNGTKLTLPFFSSNFNYFTTQNSCQTNISCISNNFLYFNQIYIFILYNYYFIVLCIFPNDKVRVIMDQRFHHKSFCPYLYRLVFWIINLLFSSWFQVSTPKVVSFKKIRVIFRFVHVSTK